MNTGCAPTIPRPEELLAAEHAGARVASFDDQLTKAAAARNLDTVGH